MLLPVKEWFARRSVPSADDVKGLLENIETLHKDLTQHKEGLRQHQRKRLEDVDSALTHVKGQIPVANDAVDAAAWAKKVEDERWTIADTLAGIFNDLRWINEDSLRAGKAYFTIFFCLLLAIGFLYLVSVAKPTNSCIIHELACQGARRNRRGCVFWA